MTRRNVRAALIMATAVAVVGLVAAQGPSGHDPARDVPPKHWRENRLNLRWAGAASNLSYITRYIAEGMIEQLGKDTGYIAYGAVGHSTYANIVSVGEYEADFGITTPPVMAKIAMEGKAYFQKKYPDLRSIAVYPQNDWLMCVARPELGIRTFDDIKAKKVPVKIATNLMGRPNGISFLVEQILAGYGIAPKDIEAWGGGFIEVEGAPEAAQKVLDGEANMACHEYWKAFYRLTDKVPVVFLPTSDAVLASLEKQFGYRRTRIPKDTFGPGKPAADVPAVDYSDWVVLANSRVPDDIAYLAAKVAVEGRVRGFEVLYQAQSERQRSADIPVRPELMWKNVGVPLHPGAERYYREAGLMK